MLERRGARAVKNANRIQRSFGLAIPAPTRQERKKQNAQASNKKKNIHVSGSTLAALYYKIAANHDPIMDESWNPWLGHDWFLHFHDWSAEAD